VSWLCSITEQILSGEVAVTRLSNASRAACTRGTRLAFTEQDAPELRLLDIASARGRKFCEHVVWYKPLDEREQFPFFEPNMRRE
jgi:hypothetical protein